MIMIGFQKFYCKVNDHIMGLRMNTRNFNAFQVLYKSPQKFIQNHEISNLDNYYYTGMSNGHHVKGVTVGTSSRLQPSVV